MKTLSILILSIISFGCSDKIEDKSQTSQNEKGKVKVSDLSYRNMENIPSPINLNTKIVNEHKFDLEFNIKPELNALLRKVHTIELKISAGSTAEAFYHKYNFKQLHFHTPAEHSIDEVKHPMEMHLVSMKLDSLEPDLPKYLVIGVTFKEGKSNPFIESIINKVPKVSPTDFHAEGEDKHPDFSLYVDLSASPISLDDLFGDKIENHLDNLIHYKGSLTTYPYTESVEWYVLKEVVEASKEQISKMNEIMGDNSRLTQEKKHLDYGFNYLFD